MESAIAEEAVFGSIADQIEKRVRMWCPIVLQRPGPFSFYVINRCPVLFCSSEVKISCATVQWMWITTSFSFLRWKSIGLRVFSSAIAICIRAQIAFFWCGINCLLQCFPLSAIEKLPAFCSVLQRNCGTAHYGSWPRFVLFVEKSSGFRVC